MSIAVHWPVAMNAVEGAALGYTRANNSLRVAARAAGMDDYDGAPTALHFATPELFHPIEGKRNVLYCMFESDYLSPPLVNCFPKADAIITPSTYCAEVFRGYTDKPIYVVPLGVDTGVFTPARHSRPRNRPFRWLWVGSWGIRKGPREVLGAWYEHFRFRRDCELYIKTGEHPTVQTAVNGNLAFDTRLLSDSDMRALYASADAFVFPTYGEGFALTLLEAFASGLPCIAPLRTGITEYADHSTCFDVETVPYVTDVRDGPEVHKELVQRVPLDALAKRMNWIMTHWTRAKRVGLRAAKRAQEFTWAAAGQKLVAALEVIAGNGRASCAA